MKALFLTLLLSYSCTKYADLSKDAIALHISPVTMEISHLDEVEWHVGTRREEKVSQSFTFIVDMPKLKTEDLDYLTGEKEIDSWILRLIVDRGPEKQDLGSVYGYFRPKKMSRLSQSGGTSSISFKVSYAAAYASERFRAFKCPAFGHNKRIKEMDIAGPNEEFSLSITQSSPYPEKSQLVELTPATFNGGNSLRGEYYIEIAAYDSKKKIVHSSFKRIPMYVSIKEEESVNVKSCEGIHMELE